MSPLQVAGKLTQKEAPEDPNELARREDQKRRMREADQRMKEKQLRKEQFKARIEAEREREDRAAQMAALEEEKKAAVRRRELMTNPELWSELQGMEIQRGALTLYSCKLCGIQAMTLADAESHIFEEEHTKLRSGVVLHHYTISLFHHFTTPQVREDRGGDGAPEQGGGGGGALP